jgi:hypothetical protein
MTQQLHPDDPFPAYVVQTVAGPTLTVPHDLAGAYTVLLFYRGHW